MKITYMCAVNSFVELVFTDTVWCILYHNNVLLLSGSWISSICEKVAKCTRFM